MSKTFVKQYAKNYAQRAPSQLARTIFAPGKLSVTNSQAGASRDYHVPYGNPAIEDQLRDHLYQGVWLDPEIPVTSPESFPTPVVSDTTVEVVHEVGIEGTHERNDTLNIDIHKHEKSSGGTFFDDPYVLV